MRFMDLLFSKYASPFILLDGYIQTGRFTEFVCEFIKIQNEDKEEKQIWDLYLHKVFDKSFDEFKKSLKTVDVPKEQIETTVKDSKAILNNFIPKTGVNHGTF